MYWVGQKVCSGFSITAHGCWSWNSNTLVTWCEELTHWKRPWCWERLRARGEGNDRGWDGWMALSTWWTWVWVDSRSWWWTGRPGMLWIVGSQRVSSDMTEDWTHRKTWMNFLANPVFDHRVSFSAQHSQISPRSGSTVGQIHPFQRWGDHGCLLSEFPAEAPWESLYASKAWICLLAIREGRRAGSHLGHSGQEIADRLLEGAHDGAAQGPHGGEALHVLVGQDGLSLFLALGQRHIPWLGAHDAPIHLCHGLGRLFWRGKTHKAKPFAVATLCHHLKARQDKGCWGWRRKTPGVKFPSLPRGGGRPGAEGTHRSCNWWRSSHP